MLVHNISGAPLAGHALSLGLSLLYIHNGFMVCRPKRQKQVIYIFIISLYYNLYYLLTAHFTLEQSPDNA